MKTIIFQAIGFLEHVGDYINLFNIQPNVTQDSLNDINQNTNIPSAPSTENTDNVSRCICLKKYYKCALTFTKVIKIKYYRIVISLVKIEKALN